MPYAIAVDRPVSDAPVAKADNYMRWYQWAKENAPFTSVTMDEWAGYLLQLNHPTTSAERKVMMTEGSLLPKQIKRLLMWHVLPPDKVLAVFIYAASNDYPVTFTPTSETISQYLANIGSAAQT